VCGVGTSSSEAGTIGRDIHLLLKRQENVTCHECCTGDLCNHDLCAFEPSK